jgi:hypothetical protein
VIELFAHLSESARFRNVRLREETHGHYPGEFGPERRAAGQKFENPAANPYHKTLMKHGFTPVSSQAKANRFAKDNPNADYTEHVYKHPKLGGNNQVIVTQYHGKTSPYRTDKPHGWHLRYEQSNKIIAPTTGDTKPQLDRALTHHYGEPKQ